MIPQFVTVPGHMHLSEILWLGLDDAAFVAMLAGSAPVRIGNLQGKPCSTGLPLAFRNSREPYSRDKSSLSIP